MLPSEVHGCSIGTDDSLSECVTDQKVVYDVSVLVNEFHLCSDRALEGGVLVLGRDRSVERRAVVELHVDLALHGIELSPQSVTHVVRSAFFVMR